MKAQLVKNENWCLEKLKSFVLWYWCFVWQGLLFFQGNEGYNYKQLPLVIITNSFHWWLVAIMFPYFQHFEKRKTKEMAKTP